MSIVKSIEIEKFRALEDQTITFNRPVNAIIGKNGAMKTTLLGMIAHPFSLKTSRMSTEKPLCGGNVFNSPMNDKFKFSEEFDKAHEHRWSLYVDKRIYSKEKFTCESERRSDSGAIRFWSTEGREKGMNFIQCPVIYLSMKRLLPLGEEKKLDIHESSLNEEEKRMYIRDHNRVLISTDEIKNVSELTSVNKKTVGPRTLYSDAITISAGQDNIGRIILAVFSMKRLKEKYEKDYKGGIICIDEIESTLYPAAQEKLIDYMYDMSEEYNIQFFFTTHSMSIVKYLKLGGKSERNSITYLKKTGQSIKSVSNPSLRDIENDLNVESGKALFSKRIKVYSEDSIGATFCKNLLTKEIKQHVEFVGKMDLGWTNYKTLISHKVPEFVENIIVLDGDVSVRKDRPNYDNVVFLPGKTFPEEVVYKMLHDLEATADFWDNEIGGYNKEVCFKDFLEFYNSDNNAEIKVAIKNWFLSQKENMGKYYMQKLFGEWKKKNPDMVEAFIKKFVCAYNAVAKKTGFEEI